MARPKKQTVDYYPHVAKAGKTIFILESRWGNDGYAFLHKLLETICSTNGHVINYGNPGEKEFLLAKTRTNEETATAILDKLAELGKIDSELWAEKYIWYQNLVNNVKDAYKKRIYDLPTKPCLQFLKPHSIEFPLVETPLQQVFVDGSTESKVKETKLNNTKEEEIASVYRLFQNEMGIISNIIFEKIADDIEHYSATWVTEALKIAVVRGKRNLGYVESILADWRANGYNLEQKPWDIEKKHKGANNNGNATNRQSTGTIQSPFNQGPSNPSRVRKAGSS